MTYWYPQSCTTLKVVWEDFGDTAQARLKQTYVMDTVPKRTRIDINSYTEADTFELSLDFKTFPFDPRCIRSCQVSVHMQNMEKLYTETGLNLIVPKPENAVFLGFADMSKLQLDEMSRTVTLTGRDYTSLYIDAIWPGEIVDLAGPVDKVVAKIIGRLKATGDITVDNRTGSPTLPTLASFYPDFGALSGKRNARKKETYWDVIQDICGKAGLIAYIELDKLVITKPRTLYNADQAVSMVYGKNVSNLEITRNFGKQKGFNVVVRSIIGKAVVEVNIPKDSKKLPEGGDFIYLPKQGTNGALVDKNQPESVAPIIAFAVANVRDKNHLIEIGEKIYEEMARQQLEGRLVTKDMQAPMPNQSCFDILKIRNGSPISVQIDHVDLQKIQQTASVPDRVTYLLSRGYNTNVATVLAQTIGKVTTPFYCRAVQFSLDETSGFSCDIDFVNFIETAGKGLGL